MHINVPCPVADRDKVQLMLTHLELPWTEVILRETDSRYSLFHIQDAHPPFHPLVTSSFQFLYITMQLL